MQVQGRTVINNMQISTSEGTVYWQEDEPLTPNDGDTWFKVVNGAATNAYNRVDGAWVEVEFASQIIAEELIGKVITAAEINGGEINGTTITGAEFINTYKDVVTGLNIVTDGGLSIKNGILLADADNYVTDSEGERQYKLAETDASLQQASLELSQKTYNASGTEVSRSTSRLSGGSLSLTLSDSTGNYNGVLNAKALTSTPWVNITMGPLFETAESNPPQYRIIYNLDGSKTIKFRGQVKLKSGTMNINGTSGDTPKVYLPFSTTNTGGPHYLPAEVRPQRTTFAYAPVGVVKDKPMFGAQWAITDSGYWSLGVFQNDTTYAVLSTITYDIV